MEERICTRRREKKEEERKERTLGVGRKRGKEERREKTEGKEKGNKLFGFNKVNKIVWNWI